MARIKCNINEMMAITLGQGTWYSPIISTPSLKAIIFFTCVVHTCKGDFMTDTIKLHNIGLLHLKSQCSLPVLGGE